MISRALVVIFCFVNVHGSTVFRAKYAGGNDKGHVCNNTKYKQIVCEQ